MVCSGAVAAALLALVGCGLNQPAGYHGDCAARIHFQDTVFDPLNTVNQSAAVDDAKLGTGDVVGCDLKSVDQVVIHKVHGVDPDTAIAVVGKEWRGIYVQEHTKPTDWPTQLRAE